MQHAQAVVDLLKVIEPNYQLQTKPENLNFLKVELSINHIVSRKDNPTQCDINIDNGTSSYTLKHIEYTVFECVMAQLHIYYQLETYFLTDISVMVQNQTLTLEEKFDFCVGLDIDSIFDPNIINSANGIILQLILLAL